MDNSLLRAYSEIDKILSFMEFEYIEKIPKKLRETFKNEKLKDYKPDIDKNIPLNEQNLERKTYAILAMLNLHYWCNNKEEKRELLKAYSYNDKKRQEELRDKYNANNIFKNKAKEIEKQETKKEITALIEYKEESFIKKIIDRIKRLFIR